MSRVIHIGIIAGEPSGDVLAAGLIKAIKLQAPNARFSGIGGKHMLEAGMQSIVDMNELSVMGLVEVLSRLPRLWAIKQQVIEHFNHDIPDVFVGVDAPDFNLRIETALKAKGIPTVHYVSPTVWAWREGRIHKIAKATSLVLGLFPFEAKTYETYQVPYQFVGHTLADSIPLIPDKQATKDGFALTSDQSVLAVLPGSRKREIDSLLPDFLLASLLTARALPDKKAPLVILIPAANDARKEQIQTLLALFLRQHPDASGSLNVQVVDGHTRECLIASDVVLIASGTATLEAMLCKRPMVVAYKMAKLTHWMMGRMYKPDYFSLPNLLANAPLVTELLQGDVNPENLKSYLVPLFGQEGNALKESFTKIHKQLKCDADEQAANAVLSFVTVDGNE